MVVQRKKIRQRRAITHSSQGSNACCETIFTLTTRQEDESKDGLLSGVNWHRGHSIGILADDLRRSSESQRHSLVEFWIINCLIWRLCSAHVRLLCRPRLDYAPPRPGSSLACTRST